MEKQRLNISCDTITLDVFIRCVVYNDLRDLGDYPNEELKTIWEQVYEEYVQISGNKAYKNVTSLIQRTATLQAKLQLATAAMQNEDFDILNKLGYKGGIDKAVSKIQKDTISLQQRQNEIEQATTKDQRTLKESDFTVWIVQVGKFMGYRIDRKITTVSEFVEMSKQMEQEIKSKLPKK